MKRVLAMLRNHAVPVTFLLVSLALCIASRQSASFLTGEILNRLVRNSFTTLSLLIPVLAGLGLNFGIVIGAMAGQMAIVTVVHWNLTGFSALGTAWILALPIAVIFGWLVGCLFNRAKGREMVTGLIAGFFSNGLYQLLFLFLVGSLIPFSNPDLILPQGFGLRNTVNLKSMEYSLDDVASVSWMAGKGMEVRLAGKVVRKPEAPAADPDNPFAALRAMSASFSPPIKLPLATAGIIVLLCVGIRRLLRTKLGQDMRAVGQDMHIAAVAGIPVDQVRMVAVILSTVLAAWGQIIYLQNMGTLNTYSSHEQIGMFAVASLLVGGATVSRATVWQALMGTLMFHTLFVTSPLAGKHLMGDPQIGEYFRVFIAYGVIAVALALHAWGGGKKSSD